MAVFEQLANRAGQVVTKDELLQAVWRDAYVSEDVLWRAISSLRRVLDDQSGGASLIETLPRRGYRLRVAPDLEPSPAPATSPPTEPTAVALPEPQRVVASAELPTAQPNVALRQGLRQAPIARLVVGTLLALVAAAALVLLARRPTPSPTSTPPPPGSTADLLARGWQAYSTYTDRGIEAAIHHFRAAIEREPDHAAAWSALANAQAQKALRFDGSEVVLAEAESTALTAIRLAPNAATSHRALAMAYGARGWLARAAAAYEASLAIEALPGVLNNLALIETRRGRPERALELLDQLPDRGIGFVMFLGARARARLALDQPDSARKALEAGLELAPYDPETLAFLVAIDLGEGQLDRARSRLETSPGPDHAEAEILGGLAKIALASGDPARAADLWAQAAGRSKLTLGHCQSLAQQAAALVLAGKPTAAAPLAANVEQWVEGQLVAGADDPQLLVLLAAAQAVRDDHDNALAALTRAVDAGYSNRFELLQAPAFVPLRDQPAWGKLLAALETRAAARRAEVPVDPTYLTPARR